MDKLNILLTGGSGFIGQYFLKTFGHQHEISTPSVRITNVQDLDLTHTDVIIHMAGKAHEMGKIDDSIYFNANYELTKILATKAKEAGVKQFIYFSSTKVFGEGQDEIYHTDTPCNPSDPYGKSKLMAEEYLKSIASNHFLVTIIRPPLVYGPGVKGNLKRLLDLCSKNSRLPFKHINNKRSMIFVGNLVHLTMHCIINKSTGVLLAGDRELVSTSDLLHTIIKHLGVKNKLFSIPLFLRKIIKHIKKDLYIRLFGSFVINSTQSNNNIRFTPPFTFDEGMRETVDWYKVNSHDSVI